MPAAEIAEANGSTPALWINGTTALDAPGMVGRWARRIHGTGVPARPSETAGRAGKAGEARTREAKVGALWVAEPDGKGGRRTVDGSVRYFAAVESAADDAQGDSPVARRLLRELAAAG